MIALLLLTLLADDPTTKMVRMLSPERIAAVHKQTTARPHIAGTSGSRAHAELLARILGGYSLSVETHSYWTLLSYPRRMTLRMFRNKQGLALPLIERSDARDADTSNADLMPGYIAYSGVGRVRGVAVDAGYGLAADYDGVAAKDAIVMVRRGKSSVADVAKVATEHGAAGVVVYSEPPGARAWPLGAGRAAWFVERDQAGASQIPVATISSTVAEQVLGPRKKLAGVELEIDMQMTDTPRPIFNVIASLEGTEKPEHLIMLETHHDAWGFGGVDPGMPESALLEVARVLGAMSREGWKPRHTIQFVFWDAGEFGNLGAAEHAKEFPNRSFTEFPVPDQEAPFGARHSNYDTAAYMTRWRDPGFRATRSLAETVGRAALRLASEPAPARTLPTPTTTLAKDAPARGEVDYAEARVAKAREAFAAGVVTKSVLDVAERELDAARERYERLREGSGQLTPSIAADEVSRAELRLREVKLKLEILKTGESAGMVARNDLDQANARVKEAEEYLDLARVREQELGHEWELLRKVKEFEARGGRFDDSVLDRLSVDYEKQFGHVLPVSALGMTHTHELLNFDHTGRVDVALSPDSAEGRWLIEQLTLRDIPFLVFRSAVAGKATGAHIHLGLPSPRLHK